MFFQHVYDKSLAQGSYLIGCQKTGEAIVIDAQRDIDVYLEIAKKTISTLRTSPKPTSMQTFFVVQENWLR